MDGRRIVTEIKKHVVRRDRWRGRADEATKRGPGPQREPGAHAFFICNCFYKVYVPAIATENSPK
jgi:hypothetical protein